MPQRSILDGCPIFALFLAGADLRADVWVRAWCAECGEVQDGLLHRNKDGESCVLVHCECGTVTRHVDDES